MHKVVRVFIDDTSEEVPAGVYVGAIGDFFIKDGHRTLEVALVFDLSRDEDIDQQITITKWKRTTWKHDELHLPNLWVKECLSGWLY